MTNTEAAEGARLVQAVLADLLLAVPQQASVAGSTFRLLAETLSDAAPARVRSWTVSSDLLSCFRAATAAGATLVGMSNLVSGVLALRPVGAPAQAVAQLAMRLGAAQLAKVVQGTNFVSRDDVDQALAFVNGAFDPIEEIAADARDGLNYQALVALHRRLPRVITYSLPSSVPALVLAYRLYGDAGRANELVQENKVVHPLFMPRQGRGLSA